jgi:hypothetical protein
MLAVIQWELILELSLLFILIAAAIAVSTILFIRSLRTSYREVFRYQSKFDIELRKTGNLLSKVIKNDQLDQYASVIVKEMPFEDKKNMLDLIDSIFQKINSEDQKNKYVIQTYENLQEIRRILDAKVLSFNHQITLFPFNIFAKILKYKKMAHYTHQ